MTSPDTSDDELLRAAQAGDQAALGALLECVRPELEVWLRVNGAARLRTRESVGDVVQSVFAECIPSLGSFLPRGDGTFRAWLRQLALHKLVSKQRYHLAQARHPAREASGAPLDDFADSLHQLPSPSRHACGREEAERLRDALELLPEDQRQVVTMARLFEMPHAAIAAVLGKSEPACRMLLQRGLVKLTQLLVRLESRG